VIAVKWRSQPIHSNQEPLETLLRDFSARGLRRRRRSRFARSFSWGFAIWTIGLLKRAGDVCIALALLMILSPLLVLLFVLAKATGGGIEKAARLGRWATTFNLYSFQSKRIQFPRWLSSLPQLLNLLRGDLSLVGPRAIALADATIADRLAWKRFDVRPGLVCIWWIRKRANIAYASESQMDAEYADTYSLSGDVGIVLRAIPALIYGQGKAEAPERINMLGITMHNLTMPEAVKQITSIALAGDTAQVSFVNADCANIAFERPDYRKVLQRSRLVLADGIGVRLAGKLLNQNIRENVNGTDLLPFLCASMEREGLRLYLLGGRPGVPEAAVNRLEKEYPNLNICGSHHGYFSEREQPAMIEEIARANVDVLLVAFGVPKQETWISSHQEELGAKVCVGVGGLLDFYSGRIPRAPDWMRELGMEWVYRFIQEPRRMWRRYLVGNVVFLLRVLRERMLDSKNSKFKTSDEGVA